MKTHTPIKYPTRAWSNMTEFEEWIEEARRAQQPREIKPQETTIDGQKVGFDTYVSICRKHPNFAHCLCSVEDGFVDNYILINGEFAEVPLQWSEGDVTATQTVEGKISKDMMRSQKLVLCKLEERGKSWFEVTVLNDDLTYPFNAYMLGLKCWAFADYIAARKKYNALIREVRKQAEERAND